MDRLLDRRALNRALLERQLLLTRHRMPVLDAVRHLVGLQAQAPTPPYYGLWSRLAGFDPAELSRLLLERRAVRAPLMRATLHLVAAQDCLPLRGLLQPVFDRSLAGDPVRSAALAGIDLDKLAATGRELLTGRPHTARALGTLLAQRWPDRDAAALSWGVHLLVPLLQVPPRGIWGARGQASWAPADAWLDPTRPEELTRESLVRRYLAAFGPATAADLQQWSGLTGLGEVLGEMQLRTFRDESGRRLYDLPDAPLPDPDTPAPVRFVAPFDNLLLSHADRTRVIAGEHRPRVFTINGIVRGTVLVGGAVAATWAIDQSRGKASLTVSPFGWLAGAELSAVTEEAARLLEFANPGAEEREVVVAPPA